MKRYFIFILLTIFAICEVEYAKATKNLLVAAFPYRFEEVALLKNWCLMSDVDFGVNYVNEFREIIGELGFDTNLILAGGTNECPHETNSFIRISSRSTISRNIQEQDLKGVFPLSHTAVLNSLQVSDTINNRGYFVRSKVSERTVSYVFIGYFPKIPNPEGKIFLKSLVHQEIFQATARTFDVPVHGKSRSIIEETEDPDLQVKFNNSGYASASDYLDDTIKDRIRERIDKSPKNICMMDASIIYAISNSKFSEECLYLSVLIGQAIYIKFFLAGGIEFFC